MHSPEIRQKFIELRADAHSIPRIASLLGVAQSTLRLWEKDDALEIAHLRCSYWQDAEDKVGITIEHRLRRMAEWIKGAEDELEKRHFDLMNNRDLMRFLREARREYFRLRAMLFNAPGARASSPAATTAKTKTTKLNPTPATLEDLPPTNTPLQDGGPEQPHDPPTASAVSPSEPAPHKIDKIGELADFPKIQPRNTNGLQQSKSSPADFSEPLALVADDLRAKPRCETESNSSQVTSPYPPGNPEPPSAYAAQAEQPTPTPQPIQHPVGVPHLCGPEPQAIPKSSNPFFYYSPEGLFVPSTPFHSGEPIRLFLARCREADLAAQLNPTPQTKPIADEIPPTNTPLHRLSLPTSLAHPSDCSTAASHPVAETHDLSTASNWPQALPLPRGEGWGEGQTGTTASAASPVPEPYIDQPPNSHPNMTIALPASNLTMACSPAGGRDGKEFYG